MQEICVQKETSTVGLFSTETAQRDMMLKMNQALHYSKQLQK